MKYTLDWLTDPEVFAVNRIAAHSDHRIYANQLEADADNSSLIQNLNGTWKFAWAKNPSEWQQKFYEESDSTDNFDNIQVPGLVLSISLDTFYSNKNYAARKI